MARSHVQNYQGTKKKRRVSRRQWELGVAIIALFARFTHVL